MDSNENIQEIIHFEPGVQFKLHNNISAGRYPNHWHNAVEIVMPIKKAYEIEVNYKPYTLGEYHIFIVPSGELHSMNLSQTEGQRLILQFGFEALGAITGFKNASYVYASPLLLTPNTAPELHEPVKTLLLEVLDEHLNRKEFYEAAITQKIMAITLQLLRKKREDVPAHILNEDLSKRNKHIDRLNECLEYINHNFSEKLTLEGVAQTVGYSKYHFSRWFREYAAMSFFEYLTNVRVGRAEALLTGSEQSMTEIAMDAGFQSTNTFNRIFKKYNGCTPTQYRYMHYLRKQEDAMHDVDLPQGEAEDTPYTMKPPAPSLSCSSREMDAIYRTNPDGEYINPIIMADIPDPDVIRAGDAYYMTGTTMYFNPGIPVMKSYDLIHWEIVNYVYDILDSGDSNALRNGRHAYGKGSWASSLRHNEGIFYVAVCALNTGKTYIFQTADIENGPWSRFEISGIYHDSSLLFDDDGRVYLVYGGGTIRIAELKSDATGILPGGMDRVIIEKADAGGDGGLPAEGSHMYKIDGKYYLFLIAWPESGNRRRIQLCYRSDSVEGPYEGRVVLDDDMGYRNMGVAQGGIVDTPEGDWYAMLFQDHGAVGRVPVLMPVTWEDGFPVFGTDGRVPLKLKVESGKWKDGGGKPDAGYGGAIVCSDEFYVHGPGKDYAAANCTDYRYGYGQPPAADGQPAYCAAGNADVEIIQNTHFEDGTEHWEVMEVADIEVSVDETSGGSTALFVSRRTTTASGPRQLITGRVKAGGIYQAGALVKYTSGPPEKTFNICMRNGSTWEGIRIIGSGKLAVGQWGHIGGTYTVPENADLSESSVFIETPWVDKPKKETDLMDFYVGSVSVVEKPAIRNTAAMPGENDPPDNGLMLCWQWSHNPDNNLWTLEERPGFLRLKSAYLCNGLLDARNTLTQRAFGPVSTAVAALETQGMKDGDVAGLAALQELYGYVGVKAAGGRKYIVMENTASETSHKEEVSPHMLAGVQASVPLPQDRVYLRVEFDFDNGSGNEILDEARFCYSLDELNWHMLGEPLPMEYRLSHFTGYRFALFYFATQVPGGYADFGYFRLGREPIKHDSGLKTLDAYFINDTQALGIAGTEIRASICMDALPEDEYKGIYLSLPIPDILEISEITLHNENISGVAGYSPDGNRLLVSVTGDCVSFMHKTSDRFADLTFKINRDISEDAILNMRPDYIYIDGGNAAYLTHGMCAVIHIYAPDKFTRGWHEQNSNL